MFHILKENKFQPTLLNSANIYYLYDEEIMIFYQKSLRDIWTHESTLRNTQEYFKQRQYRLQSQNVRWNKHVKERM